VRVEPEFLIFRDGLLYVGAERLGDLFSTLILVDWTELTASIVDPTVFPAGRRAQRQAAREAFLRRAELLRPELTLPAERRRLDGLVLDYSVLAPSDAPIEGATYTATLGADLLGGSLALEVATADPADAAGGYTIQLAGGDGENPVDFVAYGPLGELRQFNRTYRVLSELLPAKRFEYGVSGGSCRTPQCRSSANLDLRYGGGDRWTVQAGYDRFWRDSLSDLSHPYVGITTNPTNAWAIDAMAVQGAFATGEVRFEPTVDLRLSGGYTRFATGTRAPILTVAGRSSQWTAGAFVRPMPGPGVSLLGGA